MFSLLGEPAFLEKWLLESFARANDQPKLNTQMVVLSCNPLLSLHGRSGYLVMDDFVPRPAWMCL